MDCLRFRNSEDFVAMAYCPLYLLPSSVVIANHGTRRYETPQSFTKGQISCEIGFFSSSIHSSVFSGRLVKEIAELVKQCLAKESQPSPACKTISCFKA